jgi:alpha-tubulin suppressor-like RCC1 family protein
MDAGLQFTCALWNGDDVTCWGENVRYQLGATGMIRVNTIDDLTFTPLGLSVGGNHACTWTDTEVWCWGDNRSAQLGIDPATENRFAEPQLVATAKDVVAVAAGNGHTCAAVEGGSAVRCVGAGDVGQLGVMLPEPETWSVDSVAIEGLPPGDRVADLQARVDHTCARLQSGDIWCWGGLQGRFRRFLLKDDMANEPLVPPARVDAPDEFADETIVRMGVGTQHICVLTDETRVWCWGSDSVDQIGPLAPANGMDAVELDLACPL